MVSFSCDACQNVFTKPKVENHFHNCRSQSVSCIDCGTSFSVHSVRAHTSCITEAEKFGPKTQIDACTQTFCGVCSISLNGAVHAVQHYDSRRHRAGLRRQASRKKSEEQREKHVVPKDVKCSPVETGAPVVEGAVVEKKEGDVRFKGCHSRAKMGVKRAMKKVLKCARKGRLARRALVKEVAEILGDATPSDLGDVVDGKVKSSRRFKMSKGRVVLLRAD